MRLKTEARRQAILQIATELFREVGYERATMAEISARLGGSKATLYSYFSSKEELFADAMMEAMEEQGLNVMRLLATDEGDLRAILQQFGDAYLEFVTASSAMEIMRIAVAEGAHSQLGAKLYRLGPKRGWLEISAGVRQLQDRGLLKPGDPGYLAAHLKGMLETGIVEPILYGARAEFSKKEAVAKAVDAFLRAYGANTS